MAKVVHVWFHAREQLSVNGVPTAESVIVTFIVHDKSRSIEVPNVTRGDADVVECDASTCRQITLTLW
jgi:hypothetical protein